VGFAPDFVLCRRANSTAASASEAFSEDPQALLLDFPHRR
jgi:hypothetical protein